MLFLKFHWRPSHRVVNSLGLFVFLQQSKLDQKCQNFNVIVEMIKIRSLLFAYLSITSWGVWGSEGINPHFLKILTVKVSGHVHTAFPKPTYGIRCRLTTITDLGRFREETNVSLAGNTAPSRWSSISYFSHYPD